ncbi:MAG: hypothetical protein EBS18_01345, partial [Actinobacteria bacterium]|nr:hypothetical protein [Actinomycetota bacterium]
MALPGASEVTSPLSAAYQYATGEGGIGLEAMNQNILNFFAGSPTESAARAAMSEYGVSDADILRATGRSLLDYFPAAPVANYGVLPDRGLTNLNQDAEYNEPASNITSVSSEPVVTPSAAYQYATGQGGIGIEAMNQNIRNFFANAPTKEAAQAAMSEYGVSDADILRATGKSFADYFPTTSPLGSLSAAATGNDTVSGGALPVSRDAATKTSTNNSNLTLIDFKGNQYKASDLTNLYGQIAGSLDPNSTGGVFKAGTGQSIGFDYNEIQKLFGEGKSPTVGDQVLLDIARGLLSEGITDLKQLEGAKLLGTYGRGLQQYQLADGRIINTNRGNYPLGETAAGTGKTTYSVDLSTGKPIISTTAVDTSDRGSIAFALSMLSLAFGGPGALGSTLTGGAATGLAATAIGSGALSFANGLIAGKDPIQAIRDSVKTAGTTFLAPTIASMVPAEFNNIANQIVTQLITTGKVNPISLATTAGIDIAAGQLATETGIDKATATKFINAGIQASKGNVMGALTSLSQAGGRSGLSGVTGNTGSGNVIDEYNVVSGGLSTSANPTEDQQIAQQQLIQAANQAISDYQTSSAPDRQGLLNQLLGLGLSPLDAEKYATTADNAVQQQLQIRQTANQAISDYQTSSAPDRQGLINQLTNLGLSAADAAKYADQADKAVQQRLTTADVMNRYSKIDPEFGSSQLDRNTAIQQMVAAGVSSDRANELLNGIDAQNTIKLENKLSVQSAYQNFAGGKGSEEALRSAMTSAGYTDTEIENQVLRGRAYLEGSKLTAGEQAQQRGELLRDIRAEAAAKPTFAEAYALVRDKLGPGATFTWQGKEYVASSAAERPDLVPAKTSVTGTSTTQTQDFGSAYVAPNGMHNRAAFVQAGGGTSEADYAKYVNAVNAVIAGGQSGTLIKPSSVNSAGKDLPPTTGEVTMEKPRVDSVLGSIAAHGVASYGANTIAGVLSSLGFTDAGKAVMNKANAIANAATEAEGVDITQGKKAIDGALSQVGGSTNFRSFASNMGNLVSTVYNNPKAFGATVGSEFVEEVLQIASLKGLPAGFAVKEAISSSLENGGAAYNTEYASQIKQGASQEVAHDKAQKAAGVAAGTTVALMGAAAGAGKVIGAISGKADDVVAGPLATTKQVAKTTGKESVQEAIEEGSISAAVDLALRGSVDVKNMLTNMTGGALYGGPTSGVMQATSADKLDPAALSENTSTQIQQTVNSGVDLSQAGTSVIASSLQTGLSNNQSVDTLVPSIITGALEAKVDPSTVVSSIIDTGIKSGADTSSLVTATVTASLNNGLDASTVVSSTITGALNNGTDPSTVISPTVTSALSSGADPSTVISSTVTSALATGTDPSTVISPTITSALSTGTDPSTVISSTVTSALSTGTDPSTVISSTVTSALNNGANSSTVINDAVTAAITTSVNNGGNINATATSAVASSVASAVKTGVDPNAAIESATQAATKSGSSVEVKTSTKGDITVTTATTSDSTTKVVVDTSNQITTTQTKSGTDTTTTVDTATSTSKTTNDGNIQIITEIDKTTNITTTTTTDVNTGISTVTTNTNI